MTKYRPRDLEQHISDCCTMATIIFQRTVWLKDIKRLSEVLRVGAGKNFI
jgi:hypothetical protein